MTLRIEFINKIKHKPSKFTFIRKRQINKTITPLDFFVIVVK